jgi:hypothetical protein
MWAAMMISIGLGKILERLQKLQPQRIRLLWVDEEGPELLDQET